MLLPQVYLPLHEIVIAFTDSTRYRLRGKECGWVGGGWSARMGIWAE